MNIVYTGSNPIRGLGSSKPDVSFKSVATYAEAIFKLASKQADVALIDQGTAKGGNMHAFHEKAEDIGAKYVVFKSLRGINDDKDLVRILDNNAGLQNEVNTITQVMKKIDKE